MSKLASKIIAEFCEKYTWEEPDDLMTPSDCVQASCNHTNKFCNSIILYLDIIIPDLQKQIFNVKIDEDHSEIFSRMANIEEELHDIKLELVNLNERLRAQE